MLSLKFKACLWKNYRARRLSWFFTFLEILFPGIFFGLLAYINFMDAKAASERENIEFTGEHYNVSRLVNSSFAHRQYIDILFSPTNNFTIKLMESLFTNVFIKHGMSHKIREFIGMSKSVNVATWLSAKYFKEDATETAAAVGYGFVFDEKIRENLTEPVMEYKILCTISTIDTHGNFPETIEADEGSKGETYINVGIPVMQWYIEKAFIELVYGENVPFELELHSFPYPAIANQIKSAKLFITILLPMFTMIGFIFCIPVVIRRIVQEKSTGVKELMRIMGLSSWHLWSSWLIHSVVIFLVTTSIVAVVLTVRLAEYPPILEHVSTTVVWVLLFLFCVASVIFCFAVSSFFNNGVAAMSCGVIVWISTSTVLIPIVTAENLPVALRILVCLFPTGAVNTGFNIMYYYNNRSEKLTWKQIFKEPQSSELGISMAQVYMMLLVDMVLYSVVTWYIDAVNPGTYGIAKRWNFFFQHIRNLRGKKTMTRVEKSPDLDSGIYEKPLPYLKVGISIRNLRKVYASDVVGLDGISLDIYQGVITVLLGHNGAGKTSLMGIISGLHSPTVGHVYVDGEDIFNNMKKFRVNTGICFQSNYLFTYLTVIEHFIFFGMVKGLSFKVAKEQGLVMLKEFNMYEKRSSMISTLSGGMMRRVSLAIALIGDPTVLLLDEPTSGMDPETRREVWDLILRKRGHHTIVVTTQFMEEADVLGDWIAIIDHGKVVCYGTTPFLKKTYGTGYHLTISKEKRFKSEPITKVISNHVSQQSLESNLPTIVSYNLPVETSAKFGDMFSELEQRRKELGIIGIGIQCTTIEEVFLKVGESLHAATADLNKYILANFPKSSGFKDNVTGLKLKFQQFKALLVKKLVYDLRNLLVLFIMTVIPVAVVIITFPQTSSMRSMRYQPPLKIALSNYGKTTVFSSFKPIKDYVEEYKVLKSSFQLIVEDQTSEFRYTEDVIEALMDFGKKDPIQFRLHTIVSTVFDKHVIQCFFSNIPNHAVPISVNLVTNALLRYYFPKGSVGITVTINPVDSSALEATCGQAKNRLGDTIGHQWAVSLPQCLLCIMTVFIMLPAVERSSGSKHLQLMAGVSPLLYWITCFLWDFFLYAIVVVLLVMTIIISDKNQIFSNPQAIGILVLVLILYGLSGTSYAYFASNFGTTTSNIVGNYLVFSICFGMISAIGMNIAIKKGYDGDHVVPEGMLNILKFSLPLCPHYCLVTAVIYYGAGIYQNHLCSRCPNPVGLCKEESLLVFNSKENRYGFLIPVIFLSVEWIFYLILIILTDHRVFHNIYWRLKDSMMDTNLNDDDSTQSSDIGKEKEKTLACSKNRYLDPRAIFMSVGLGKVYGKKSLRLQPLSFRVRKGECFGLLGTNGAGKSTAFKLLVGELRPTVGDAISFNNTLERNRWQYLKKIGYCPQQGALNYSFTGEEILRLFAQLRGVNPRRVETEVDNWIRLLGLSENRSLKCSTYSSGTQRKLSTAIALIGHPPIVFLDEPTAGVDPFGRRNLWGVLNASKDLGQAILLTSHSMQECEALCARLTIMVGGQLACLGNIQYLKKKFGQGYTVAFILRTIPELQKTIPTLKENVYKYFTKVKLKDEHKKLLHYHVKDEYIQLSQLFNTMEELKQSYSVIDSYMVGDTTLEQVFISFAKKHIKPEIIL